MRGNEFVVQCIGATTLDEYRKHIEKDPALERRFQPVLVPEPSVDETILILKGLRERYEIHHKLRYTDDSLVAAAQLSYQYIRSEPKSSPSSSLDTCRTVQEWKNGLFSIDRCS